MTLVRDNVPKLMLSPQINTTNHNNENNSSKDFEKDLEGIFKAVETLRKEKNEDLSNLSSELKVLTESIEEIQERIYYLKKESNLFKMRVYSC